MPILIATSQEVAYHLPTLVMKGGSNRKSGIEGSIRDRIRKCNLPNGRYCGRPERASQYTYSGTEGNSNQDRCSKQKESRRLDTRLALGYSKQYSSLRHRKLQDLSWETTARWFVRLCSGLQKDLHQAAR